MKAKAELRNKYSFHAVHTCIPLFVEELNKPGGKLRSSHQNPLAIKIPNAATVFQPLSAITIGERSSIYGKE